MQTVIWYGNAPRWKWLDAKFERLKKRSLSSLFKQIAKPHSWTGKKISLLYFTKVEKCVLIDTKAVQNDSLFELTVMEDVQKIN